MTSVTPSRSVPHHVPTGNHKETEVKVHQWQGLNRELKILQLGSAFLMAYGVVELFSNFFPATD